MGIATDTISVWEYVNADVDRFHNPLYARGAFRGNISGWLDGGPSSIVLWRCAFLRESALACGPENMLRAQLLALMSKSRARPPSTIVGVASAGGKKDVLADEASAFQAAYRDAVARRRRKFVDEHRRSGFHGSNDFSSAKTPDPPPLRHTMSGTAILPTWPLTHGSVFDVGVNKVVIITGPTGSRFGAFLLRVEQTAPASATCAFHRRYSDFSWLAGRFDKFGLQTVHRLPGKTFVRWLGSDYLEERREKLDLWVMQLGAYAEKIPALAPLVFTFLNPLYSEGADWETLCLRHH
jgi:hypothetical protein